jgi:hypothetical protein
MLYAVGSGSEVLCVRGECRGGEKEKREKKRLGEEEEGRGRRVLERCIAECDVA